MARTRGHRYGRSSPRTLQTGGTIYQRGGANFEVRKHSITRTVELQPQKSVIIPLLHYNPTESTGTTINANSKVVAQGTKFYPNTAVEDGSTVKNLHLEIQIQPKTLNNSAILDFYSGRIVTSFHDIKGEQIYGLTASGTDGKAKFTDEASTPTETEVSGTTGIDTQPIPVNPMSKDVFDTGDVIKHWWKNVRKSVIYGGQPILYNRWEKVPAKCTRSNPGMFYGMVFMNDAKSVTDDTDVMQIEIKENFTEIPLVQ